MNTRISTLSREPAELEERYNELCSRVGTLKEHAEYLRADYEDRHIPGYILEELEEATELAADMAAQYGYDHDC